MKHLFKVQQKSRNNQNIFLGKLKEHVHANQLIYENGILPI